MRSGRADVADGRLRRAEAAENFPVALRVLPRALRGGLRAVYGVVRVIDDLGDEPGDVAGSGTEGNRGRTPDERLERLSAFRDDLAAVWDGTPARAPVLRALAPVVAEAGLSREPFDRLLAANVADQRVTRYATRAELLDYCALSAEPIGQMVLELFAVPAGPGLLRDCDAVCTALQLLEHWGDVAEDRARGRVYLPAEDRIAFGVPDTDLDAARASPSLRRLVLHETDRALDLLDDGSRALGGLHGWARLAVGQDVAATRRRTDVARHLIRTLLPTTAHRRSHT
ncbi:MAG: squalene/phytoene synthase family protein [Pseudonocardia sp.]|nr:squalene/phytoene synthase family protein [Pseudonocardia sp.]